MYFTGVISHDSPEMTGGFPFSVFRGSSR